MFDLLTKVPGCAPITTQTLGFVAVEKNLLRQKVSLSNLSLSNLFKQSQFLSKLTVIGGGERKQTEVDPLTAFLMTPA